MIDFVQKKNSSNGLRHQTRNLILDTIRSAGIHTRAELSKNLGLSTSTVAHSVGKLIELGLIIECNTEDKGPGTGSGRPRKVLRPADSDLVLAGVDFGNSLLSVALGNHAGEILTSISRECDVDADPDQAIDLAVESIRELLAELGGAKLERVCVGFPMPVSLGGEVLLSSNLSKWAGLYPAELFEEKLSVPVFVANDAQLEAYGETLRGAARDGNNVLYVKVSRGIGSSFISDGNPVRGNRGLAGDIGHIKVLGRTDLCRCGERGCLEVAIGLDAIKIQIRHTHPGIEEGANNFDNVDQVTQRLIFEAGKILGSTLAAVCRLLDPQVIVIGGEVSRIDTAFIEGVRSELRESYPLPIDASEFVRQSALMPFSGATGALLYASKL